VLISISIPTLNEAATIGEMAEALRHLRGAAEIILADREFSAGGSTDGTVERARACGLRVIAARRAPRQPDERGGAPGARRGVAVSAC
jgi:glycosyltransferase involved in cell wall biosynthesis